jgi:hypothetical protein
MLHAVKFLNQPPGQLCTLKTDLPDDMQVEHSLLADLLAKLERPGKSLLAVCQQLVVINDAES